MPAHRRSRALVRAALALGIFVAVPAAGLLAPSTAAAASNGTISGIVTNAKTKKTQPQALVILQCSCLQKPRETQTNEDGIYSFRDLPPGTYTVQVLAGQSDISKKAELPRGAKLRCV